MRQHRALGLIFALAACGRSRAVEFQGESGTRLVAPDAVVEASVMPRGAQRLGRLSARCRAVSAAEAFSERSLVDVDCSEQRLRRLLREAASEHGGDVLAELHCQTDSSLSCSAHLVRRAAQGEPRPLPGPAPRPDVRGELGSQVLVSYEPRFAWAPRAARPEHAVREHALLSPPQVAVGNLETHCEDCSELAARDALRIAAGRVGASHVLGVRCLPTGPGQHCIAEIAVAERDE
jgi:hypothetical protein